MIPKGRKSLGFMRIESTRARTHTHTDSRFCRGQCRHALGMKFFLHRSKQIKFNFICCCCCCCCCQFIDGLEFFIGCKETELHLCRPSKPLGQLSVTRTQSSWQADDNNFAVHLVTGFKDNQLLEESDNNFTRSWHIYVPNFSAVLSKALD